MADEFMSVGSGRIHLQIEQAEMESRLDRPGVDDAEAPQAAGRSYSTDDDRNWRRALGFVAGNVVVIRRGQGPK